MTRLKQFFAAALVAALLALPTLPAFGQSSPGLIYGQVPTAAQWNSYFAAKQDVLGYTPLNRAGGTMTGPLITVASTVGSAGFNIPQGAAPTTPNNGDIWTTSAGLFLRIAGTTIGPIGPATGTVSSVDTGTGLTGGPITSTGTISLAAIAADNILGNPTGSSAAPVAMPLVSCSTASSALIYNTTTHLFGCNTISGAGTVNTGTAGQLGYYAGTGDAISGNSNVTVSGGQLTLGVAGSTAGSLRLSGSTSGTVILQTVAVAGSTTVTWGATSGTPAVSASSPLTILSTGVITCSSCGVTTAGLSQFSSTTSLQLAGVISDETGSGSLVFGTSPTLASPTLSGTVAGANTIPLSILKTQAADTVVMNASASVASPTAVALLSCSTANSALTYSTGTHSFGCNALSTIITVPLNTPNGNQGVWLLSNATYDPGTDTFSCVDNTKYAYGLNMRTATLPFEPIADSGIAFWRTTCTTTPIGGYATIGGWEAQIISDQFRNMVVGGMGIEVDGSGSTTGYTRTVNSINSGNTYRGLLTNAYADLSGTDSAANPSWMAAVVNDGFSICRAPATAGLPSFTCSITITNAGVVAVGGSQVALLNTVDQLLTGGANVTPFNIGTVSSGTTTIDCGNSPLQRMLNTGASTIAAPVLDGSCIVQVVNGNGAGAITLSGFSAAPSSGATFAQAPTASATVTISNASPGVVTWTTHGLLANAQVYFTTSGGLPSPLVVGTIYYVVGSSITSNTFTVSATANGSAINTTTAGSGTHTGVKPSVFALNVLRVNGQASPSWYQQQ